MISHGGLGDNTTTGQYHKNSRDIKVSVTTGKCYKYFVIITKVSSKDSVNLCISSSVSQEHSLISYIKHSHK